MIKAAFPEVSFFVFQHCVVNGDAHMIKTELCNGTDIVFRYKRVKMFFIENGELRNPAAQVDTLLKTFKNPHSILSLPVLFL